MRKKIIQLLSLLAVVSLPMASDAQWGDFGGGNGESDSFYDGFSSDEFADRPVILCRSLGCTEISNMMTRSHLFNSIASIFHINERTKVYMCEADPVLRSCKFTGIRYGVSVGGTPGVVHIPSFTISEVMFSRNLNRISFMTTYDLQVNGVRSFCSSAVNVINVTDKKQAMVRDNNYRCQLTSDIPSIAYNIYNVDYIDLDYGIIGAYYSTGISGSSVGGGEGYVLMRFQNAPGANVQSISSGCAANDSKCTEQFSLPDGQYEVLPLRPERGENPKASQAR